MGKDKKVALLGLQNAGKTTILRYLLENQIVYEISPTKGIQIEEFRREDASVVFWDFGGQERYRRTYLEDPIKYFEDIQYVFYVVDVQDEDNLEKSIEYFSDIFEILINISPDAKISIILHKFDPDINNLSEANKNIKNFMDIISSFVDFGDIKIEYYKTSIKNPISIKKAFEIIHINENEC